MKVKEFVNLKIKKYKQNRCKHEFEKIGDERYIGVTANWALKLTKEFEQDYKCKKCGYTYSNQYIYFGGIMDNMTQEEMKNEPIAGGDDIWAEFK